MVNTFKPNFDANGLTICHLHMVSLIKSFDKLKEFISKFKSKPHDICISETRTNETNVKLINLPWYKFFCNNSKTRANGSGIFIIDSVNCCELSTLRINVQGVDDMWIEAALNDKISLVIRTVYRHPQPNYQNFVKYFRIKN